MDEGAIVIIRAIHVETDQMLQRIAVIKGIFGRTLQAVWQAAIEEIAVFDEDEHIAEDLLGGGIFKEGVEMRKRAKVKVACIGLPIGDDEAIGRILGLADLQDEGDGIVDLIFPGVFFDGKDDIVHAEVGVLDALDGVDVRVHGIFFVNRRLIEEGLHELLEDGEGWRGGAVKLLVVALMEDEGRMSVLQSRLHMIGIDGADLGVGSELAIIFKRGIKGGDAVDFLLAIAALEVGFVVRAAFAGIVAIDAFSEVIGVEIIRVFEVDARIGDIF